MSEQVLSFEDAGKFADNIFRKSHSLHSKRFYKYGLKVFQDYCEKNKVVLTQENLYKVFDDFVGSLDAQGLKGTTIQDYTTAAKRYLTYSGFEIDEKKFRNRVSVPRAIKIAEEPLTMDNIKKLLTLGKPNKNIRCLILLLLSSGMRLSEGLSLKVKDLRLGESPASVVISAEITKTRKGRVAYMSDEAQSLIKELTIEKKPDELVFNWNGDIWERGKNANKALRRVVERAALNELLDNHRIHKIHFHLLRKFFLTKGSDTIGEHAAHALCGHGFYMDTYYQKSEAERHEDYLKLMPRLTVFGNETIDKQALELEVKKQLMLYQDFTEEELKEIGELDKLSSEELGDKIREIRERRLGLKNGNTQKVIPLSELENAINAGWEYVASEYMEKQQKAIVRLQAKN